MQASNAGKQGCVPGPGAGVGGHLARIRAPFLGAVLKGSNGLEKTRHSFFLERTIKVLVMARINELLCARVGRHIPMFP